MCYFEVNQHVQGATADWSTESAAILLIRVASILMQMRS
jgi:hypothetical protein